LGRTDFLPGFTSVELTNKDVFRLAVMTLACDPSVREAEQEDLKFQASYIARPCLNKTKVLSVNPVRHSVSMCTDLRRPVQYFETPLIAHSRKKRTLDPLAKSSLAKGVDTGQDAPPLVPKFAI
jgi:hypothetical protein